MVLTRLRISLLVAYVALRQTRPQRSVRGRNLSCVKRSPRLKVTAARSDQVAARPDPPAKITGPCHGFDSAANFPVGGVCRAATNPSPSVASGDGNFRVLKGRHALK